MIRYSKKKKQNYPGNFLNKKKKKPGLKVNSELAPISLRTTGLNLKYYPDLSLVRDELSVGYEC